MQNRTGRTEQAEQDRQNKKGGTGLAEQDRKNRKAKRDSRTGEAYRTGIGQEELDWQNKIARKNCQERTARTGLPGQGCQYSAASTGLPAQGCHHRAARTGMPVLLG
jgi:hypothetical protein